jgi:hypothetical protein
MEIGQKVLLAFFSTFLFALTAVAHVLSFPMQLPRLIIVCGFLAILLTGCGNPVSELKPEEVLRRTVIGGRMLDSVALTTSGSMKLSNDSQVSTISMTATGVIHAGAAWSLNLRTITNRIASTGSGNLIVSTFSSPGNGPVFLRIDAVAGPDAVPVQRLLSGSIMTQWWLLAGDPSESRGKAVTAPALQDIGTFLSAFRVLQDHGISAENGRRHYHYSIEARPDLSTSLDPKQAPSAMKGELWIDAESFYLTRAVWHFAEIPTVAGVLSGTISLNLYDHNRASDSIFSTAPAVRFPLQSFLKIVL